MYCCELLYINTVYSLIYKTLLVLSSFTSTTYDSNYTQTHRERYIIGGNCLLLIIIMYLSTSPVISIWTCPFLLYLMTVTSVCSIMMLSFSRFIMLIMLHALNCIWSKHVCICDSHY